jgi:hypothetical protein
MSVAIEVRGLRMRYGTVDVLDGVGFATAPPAEGRIADRLSGPAER